MMNHLNGRRCGIKQTCINVIAQGCNPAGAGELDKSELMMKGACRSKETGTRVMCCISKKYMQSS